MKTRFIIALMGCWFVGAGPLFAADTLSDALQKGLLEEEANRNLPAALESYQKAVAQFDKDRQVAATAVFRLAECYRKLGRTNEATVQYQRIVREFSDQAALAKLSRDYLGAAGVTSTQTAAGGEAVAGTDEEAVEIQRIKNLIQNSPDLINARTGENGQTPLHGAAASGQLLVATYLLDNKADINLKSASGYTPLHRAAVNGHRAMVEFLLKRGAEVDPKLASNSSPGESTPLHLAARKGYRGVVEVLLQHGAAVDEVEKEGVSALHYSVINGDQAMLELLLARKANVNVPAAPKKQEPGRPVSLSSRSDPVPGSTPLHLAAHGGNISAAKALLNAGATVDALDATRQTPIHLASGANQTAMIALLIERGARVNTQDQLGQTPLFIAALGNREQSVAGLLEAKADVNLADQYTTTPLLAALANGNLSMTRRLLDAGARPDQKGRIMRPGSGGLYTSSDSLTPLQYAVNIENPELVEALLKAGADVSIPYDDGYTVLYGAVARKKLPIAQLLLQYKADTSAVYNSGGSMLHVAVNNRDKAMLELLLTNGANPNVQSYDKTTPLSSAVAALNLIRSTPAARSPSVPALVTPNGILPATRTLRSPPSTSPSRQMDEPEANVLQEMIDLLLKHGADEHLVRRSLIGVNRSSTGYTDYTFFKDHEGRNRYTLFELLARVFSERINAGNYGAQNVQNLKFPDLKRLTITRLERNRSRNIEVDALAALEAGDRSKDVWLEWGDIVEIPEADHELSASWNSLAVNLRESLQKCLTRKVTLIVKGQSQTLEIQPYNTVTRPDGKNAGVDRKPMDLKSTVVSSGRLLVSSDTTRVKVTRKTDEGAKEYVYDISSADRTEDFLWLRDGDVIEVPEK